MLQKVGHAAQGEGNCRAGGTRCCSERKLQAVQRLLPGYDIIASRLDFSVWKRMKNLAGNLQPLIYGAFPVWRNCTVPEMRGMSYQEVLRTNGQISFPEVLRQQNRL